MLKRHLPAWRERLLVDRRAVRGVVVAVCLALCAGTVLAQTRAAYLYRLAGFAGTYPYDSVRVRVDEATNETYVIYQNVVRIFNPSGMEVFSFGDDLELGHIVDLAVDRNGDIILLSYKESRSLVTRCNFRGEPLGPVEIRNLPSAVKFQANRLILRDGFLYFASLSDATVTVTTAAGEFQKQIDLLSLASPDERQKSGDEITGFTVDAEGTIYFTIAAVFKVYKVSADGAVASFGRSGSAPGRFGVLGGMTTDSHGNLLITDKLKCVVMAFDRDFKFLAEFGYRGARPENLIAPDDLAVDGRGRVYVSQARRRGVSVFQLSH